MSTDELDQRLREGREQGGFGGAEDPAAVELEVDVARSRRRFPLAGLAASLGGRGRGDHGSGRGRGRYDVNRPPGSVYYSVGDSALDAGALRSHRQFGGEKPATLGSASVSPWVGR